MASTSARFDSSHEGEFDPVRASHIRDHNTYDLPLVCARPAAMRLRSPKRIWSTTAGMYLHGRGDGKLGVQPRISRRLDDRSLIARADDRANGAGSPWRVIMLGDKLGNLIDSNLIGNLNPDPAFDTALDQARQDRLGLVVGPVPAAARQGRHRHADDQEVHRLRRQGRLRIHDDRRGLVPEFRHRRSRARECGRHESEGRDRHAGARRLCGETEGGPVAVGAVVAARPPDGRCARAVPEVGHQGHQGRLHGSQRPADGRLLPQAHEEGGRTQAAGRHARRLSTRGPQPHVPELPDAGRHHGRGVQQVEPPRHGHGTT